MEVEERYRIERVRQAVSTTIVHCDGFMDKGLEITGNIGLSHLQRSHFRISALKIK